MSRVAIIAREYPPDRGGIATLTRDYVDFLSRAAEVTVILLRRNGNDEAQGNEKRVLIDPDQPSQRIIEQVLDALCERQVDTVLFNHCGCFDTSFLLALRRKNVRIFTLIHGADIQLRARYLGVRTWLRRAYQFHLHECVIANSRSTAQIFRRRYPFTKVTVVNPGIKDFPPSVEAGAIRGRDILSVGRLVERKGFDVLLRAVAVLARNRPDISLTIIGDGPERANLEKLRRYLDLETNVTLAGGLSQNELREACRNHRIFCQLPRALPNGDVEGFGIVFLEAAAAGLPVVAGNSGGVPDAVHDGVNGLLVDPVNPEAVADALRRLVEDPQLWERMSRASLDWASEFDWASRDPQVELAELLRPET